MWPGTLSRAGLVPHPYVLPFVGVLGTWAYRLFLPCAAHLGSLLMGARNVVWPPRGQLVEQGEHPANALVAHSEKALRHEAEFLQAPDTPHTRLAAASYPRRTSSTEPGPTLPESTTAASICGEEGIEQGAKRRRAIGPIGVRAAGAVDVGMGRMQDFIPST
jgi:hypothetical protein